MIAMFEPQATMEQRAAAVRIIEDAGLRAQVSRRGDEHVVGVVGEGGNRVAAQLLALPGVVRVSDEDVPWPLVSRLYQPATTRIRVGDVVIGGPEVIVIAGPCSVESRDQLLRTARAVRAAGARMLRGGAFKPRSSPYAFQGLGRMGLELLAEARAETGLAVVTEVVAPEDVALVAGYADMLQIGARNMQNFRLLRAAGEQPRPVLLKRGMMATVDECLLAAEYVVAAGNPLVVVCERGIRTFDTATRSTLDLGGAAVLRERTHLPVLVDPSHAAGRRELVPQLARAAVALGVDGLIVEVHPDPGNALSDGRQSLELAQFAEMMADVTAIAAVTGRGCQSAAGARLATGESRKTHNSANPTAAVKNS